MNLYEKKHAEKLRNSVTLSIRRLIGGTDSAFITSEGALLVLGDRVVEVVLVNENYRAFFFGGGAKLILQGWRKSQMSNLRPGRIQLDREETELVCLKEETNNVINKLKDLREFLHA